MNLLRAMVAPKIWQVVGGKPQLVTCEEFLHNRNAQRKTHLMLHLKKVGSL
jgi:hypothetical protein